MIGFCLKTSFKFFVTYLKPNMQESACLIPIYLLEKHLVAFGHSDIISSCDYSQYEIGSDKVSVVVLSFSYPCIY